ncbi:8445_t:CDS:2, partial [Scutellospora calospora]
IASLETIIPPLLTTYKPENRGLTLNSKYRYQQDHKNALVDYKELLNAVELSSS